jgi:DNA replication protein DnaC
MSKENKPKKISEIVPDLDFVTIMSNGQVKGSSTVPTPEVAYKRINQSGMPIRYQGASLSLLLPEIKETKAAKTALDWASKPLADQGFFLLGAPGTGKTYLAAAAMNSRIMEGLVGPKFFNVPIFLDAIRTSFKFDDAEAQEDFQYSCKRAPLVVLDDFGKEKATDWATERLYVLVESRYSAMLPTIVTSNRSINELYDLGYGATVSRLLETCAVVESSGKDLRPGLRKSAK